MFAFIGPWPSKWLPPKPLQGERRREQPRQEGAGQPQKRNVVVVVDASAAQRQKVGRREAVDAEGLARLRDRFVEATQPSARVNVYKYHTYFRWW